MILEDCPSDAGTNPPRVAEESELPKVEAEEEEALFRSWSALKSFSQLAMASEEGEDEAEEHELSIWVVVSNSTLIPLYVEKMNKSMVSPKTHV